MECLAQPAAGLAMLLHLHLIRHQHNYFNTSSSRRPRLNSSCTTSCCQLTWEHAAWHCLLTYCVLSLVEEFSLSCLPAGCLLYSGMLSPATYKHDKRHVFRYCLQKEIFSWVTCIFMVGNLGCVIYQHVCSLLFTICLIRYLCLWYKYC